MTIVHRRRGLAAATCLLVMSVSIGAHAPERLTAVVTVLGKHQATRSMMRKASCGTSSKDHSGAGRDVGRPFGTTASKTRAIR